MTFRIAVTDDLLACHTLRIKVFVGEQNISMDEEFDDLDDVSTHFLAVDDSGAPVGTARLYETGEVGHLGRICVDSSCRGTGLGAALVRAGVAEMRRRAHLRKAHLGAQCHAIGFYERLGFKVCGDEYNDAGIPHVPMECDL